MKYLIVIICFFGLSFASNAQESSQTPKYFAQCMLDINDEPAFHALEESLRSNPYVSVVRLDWSTKRAFLVTKDLTSFTQTEFSSWLGEYADQATCIQVGLHGVDQVNPYPFTNCENH
jgi:hypothetical protein